MGRLLVRRLLAVVPILLIVSMMTFAISSLMPTDAAELILDQNATQEQVEEVRERLNLDDPLPVRYVEWLGDAVTGDFGTSYFNSVTVVDSIKDRLPATLSLTAASLVVAIVLGVGAGIVGAMRPGSAVDRLATLVATLGQAVPNFWVAMLLAVGFAVNLGWFPVVGYTPITESPFDWLKSITLPAVALGTGAAAALARQTRGALGGVLQHEYIRAARANGLSTRRVVFRHGIKNAMVPVVTVLGFQISALLGGSLIVEQVFGISGLGSLAVSAVQRQDIPVVQGIVITTAFIVVFVQLCTDLAYAYLNPKVRPQ